MVALPALADKPQLIVVPFTGPQAQRAEAEVVRAVRRMASIIPSGRWAASAKKLFAKGTGPDDVAAIAEDLHADWVVLGTVRRQGQEFELVVSLRNGKTGQTAERLRYPLKGPRVEAPVLSLLASEVSRAFAAIVGAPPSSPSEPTKPKTQEPERPRIATTLEPNRPVAKPRPVADRPRIPPPHQEPRQIRPSPTPVEDPEPVTAPKAGRPRWAPWFDLSAAAMISGRSFDFIPSALPRFATGVVGGLRLDGTVYPLAFTRGRLHDAFVGLGVGATLDMPFWPPSRGPDGGRYDTAELRVEGGLRWRFVLYKPMPRPELVLLVGGGLHQFTVAKKLDPDGNLIDVAPPDVAYKQVNLGLGVRLHLTEWARILVSFRYGLVLDAGAVTGTDRYGPADVYGIRVEGGLEFFAWRGLKVGAAGFFSRYAFAFPPLDPTVTATGTHPTSAVDQYFGGLFSLGYEY